VTAERRKVTQEARAHARELTIQKMQGVDVSNRADPWRGVKQKLQAYMYDIAQGFNGRIIKRNEKSIRYDGKALNEVLPPFKQIVATCRLSGEEMKILEDELNLISKE
jgi:hypothetical protein